MAINIFHEGERLAAAASSMHSTIRSLESIKKTMDTIYSRTLPMWEGKAARQHKRNYKALNTMISNYLRDTSQTKQALDNAVAAYTKNEKTQVQKVSQLDTNGIF